MTGELGFLVERDDGKYIQLDRPNQEILKPFRPGDWNLERSLAPFSTAQLVTVAYEADRQLLRLLGYHDRARKHWVDLSEWQKKQWIERGPRKPAIRGRLYAAVMIAMEDLNRDS